MAQLQSLADAPGTLREYETIYILRPDTQNDKVGEVNQKVRGIIESMGGVVLSVDNWGKRKLAYEISKELKGIYLYWQYLAAPEVVAEFERNMRMLDTVIRYMTVVNGRDVDPKTRESAVTEETYTKASSTAADEEELMMRRTDEGDDDGDDFDDNDSDERSDSSSDSDSEAPKSRGREDDDTNTDGDDR